MALSANMMEFLWLRRLVIDFASTFGSELKNPAEIKGIVFEDNQAAFVLAKKSDGSTWTKHFQVKQWFFEEHIGEAKGIVIKRIAMKGQLDDIFTEDTKKEMSIPLHMQTCGLDFLGQKLVLDDSLFAFEFQLICCFEELCLSLMKFR